MTKLFMLNIIGKKNWYFAISLLVIIPGLVSLVLWGLNLSIDFTGGSRMTFLFNRIVDQKTVDSVKSTFQQQHIEVVTTQPSGKSLIVRTKPMSEKQDKVIVDSLNKQFGS